MQAVVRAALVVLGSLCLALGLVGIAVPGLPTTPFLLLAVFFYARGSERLHRWLLTHRVLGPYLDRFRAGHGMSVREKIVAIALLWLTMGATMARLVQHHAAWSLLALVGLGVTVFLVRLPTYRPSRPAPGPQR